MRIKRKLIVLITLLLGSVSTSSALTLQEQEEMADLAAVFIYLKYDCGYSQIPFREIEQVIVHLAHANGWDLNHYDAKEMSQLNKYSYQNIQKIPLATQKKCQIYASRTLGKNTLPNNPPPVK